MDRLPQPTGESAGVHHHTKAGGPSQEGPRPFLFLSGHHQARWRDLPGGKAQSAEQPQVVGALMPGEVAAVLVDPPVEQEGIPPIPRPHAQRYACQPRRRHQPTEGFEENRRIKLNAAPPRRCGYGSRRRLSLPE